jgi:predicted dehydrogenase
MKNFAIVGIGSRSYLYSDALLGSFRDCGRLAAICDLNQVRMDYANRRFYQTYGIDPLPTYKPQRFEQMIDEGKVNTVIVTTIDRTHHHFIIRALEAGCDVISEKPLTVDEGKCREILCAVERTGRALRVTFNYRYAPRNSKVKQLLKEGAVGEVKSVHFEWFLDTVHGADYFRRWHRDKRNSGGLLVHKASHHFDLVNWWLDSAPQLVFGIGDLVFYGRANAESRGLTAFYDRGTGHPNAAGDPFALDLKADPELEGMYLEAEREDGYRRDESVFGHYISIEDDMAVLVRYRNGVIMSYHLTAYSPCEGFRIAFNGTGGRLEVEVSEKSYISGSLKYTNQPEHGSAQEKIVEEPVRVLLRPHWKQPVAIPVEQSSEGGHGGGDRRLLEDLFRGGEPDALSRAADHRAGALAVLTGIAANRSLASGVAVRIDDLVEI